MKNVIQLTSILTCLLFFLIFQNSYAQHPNDECVDALDISAAFVGSCGDFTFNGPFDLTGSTPGVDDPPEPGEQGICPNETDPNLFGDDAEEWENSIWFTWSVPDLNGDGSPVAYSIWTTDGSFNDDCGINPNNTLGGDADTQVAIYENSCPTAATGECDHYAANEDLFTVPPWISGWLTLEFTPGVTYYMGVDGWDGVQGEFCLTIVLCGVECGDSECAPVESYCECEDCRVDENGNSTCTFGDISAIEYVEETDSYFFSDDLSGNLFFCSDFVNGFPGNNIYFSFGVRNWIDCLGTPSIDTGIDITFSAGQLIGGFVDNGDGTFNIGTNIIYYIELTPADIAAGSITITGSAPDGLGGFCDDILTINFADFPQATDPFCALTCAAGGVDTDLLDNDITVCDGETFTLSTDGLEDLTLPCNSDNGSTYVYGWRVLVDIYGTGDYLAVNSWQILGTNPTIDPSTFFIDELGYMPPYFTPGIPFSPLNPYTGQPWDIQIQAAALCLNADGTIFDGCVANNAGYPNSLITITYLPIDDPLCSGMEVFGCIDDTACNYDPNATVDDGSCVYPPNDIIDCDGNCLVDIDCAGECGGTATEGTACTDANGEDGIYAADCTCAVGDCEEEITGSISSPDPLCDLSGINMIITAPDGTSTTITTDADGTFTVPGGPFPCGTYTAAFEDVSMLPTCYTDTGPTAPISFQVDGNPNTTDGPNFAANPTIPTLSQWGLMILTLLLMSFGAIQLFISTVKPVIE